MKLDLSGALADVGQSLREPYLWRDLAWFDIKQRFRRSVLGPFWITVTMAVLIAGMGPLYGAIFNLELKTYLPYLALGLVVWGCMSTIILESCGAFIAGSGVIRQTSIPLSSFVLRTVWRNLIVLAFNSVLIVVALVYAEVAPNILMLEALLGLVLLTIAAVGLGHLLAIFCARYRDMQPLIGSLVQMMMFLTPVFWRADQLPQRSIVIEWNPAYYFLEVIRAPLLGKEVPPNLFVVAASIAGVLLLSGLFLFARYRARIVYWL